MHKNNEMLVFKRNSFNNKNYCYIICCFGFGGKYTYRHHIIIKSLSYPLKKRKSVMDDRFIKMLKILK